MSGKKSLLTGCLYFTANSLARSITRLADQEFMVTGLSPAQAFLLMVVNEDPGIAPKELASQLQIAPSTVTRLIEPLEKKGFLERESIGKAVKIFPTQDGRDLQETIRSSWKSLYDRYSGILGKKDGDELNKNINDAADKLN